MDSLNGEAMCRSRFHFEARLLSREKGIVKILLAVDKSAASDKAVGFVGGMLAGRGSGDVSLTLLHIVESIPEFLVDHRGSSLAKEVYRQVIDECETAHRHEGEQLLDQHRLALIDAGVPEKAIDIKLVVKESRPEAKKVIAALSIIEEMKRGDYPIVALGRRGSSAAEGSFLGSVAEKVLRESNGRTVWVID
jgi:nucleotide-binding universal stress UspA family protein